MVLGPKTHMLRVDGLLRVLPEANSNQGDSHCTWAAAAMHFLCGFCSAGDP